MTTTPFTAAAPDSFGLTAAVMTQLQQLLPPITPVSLELAEQLFARIVWARLSEPGDAVAGTLIEAMGAAAALRLMIAGAQVKDFVAALEQYGIELSPQQLAAGIKRWGPSLNRDASLADIANAVDSGMTVVTPELAVWPLPLNDLGPHAPLLLLVRGNATLLSSFSLAVVGARACTTYGTHATAELVGEAALGGATIISGAAYGVDAAAHRAALACDSPTVAVLAGGADRPYPLRHKDLLQLISAEGAVCSEMVPGAAPTRWRFLQRNRVIAALSQATLVTEAGRRSGSLNTAGHAANLGRALGAVPGPITSAASAGCHRLIREYGAQLVTNGVELRELLGLDEVGAVTAPTEHSEPDLHVRVADALPLRGTRTAEDIATQAGISHEDARGTLAEMALLGLVSRTEHSDTGQTQWALVRQR